MVLNLDATNAALNCMALAIYAEAHTQSIEARQGVAQVILNRLRSGHFGDTVCEIVYAKGQFHGVWDVAEGRHKWPSQEDLLREKLIAHSVYFHKVPNQIGNTTYYFHDDSIRQPLTWGAKSRKTKIDNLIFY